MRSVWLGLIAALGLVAARAQSPFHDTPSGPRALKGDVLPPFGMIDPDGTFHPTPVGLPKGFVLGAHRPPETTAAGPSLALALKGAQAAVDACGAAGFRIGAAVIDSAGQARALLNADGTDGSHGFVAMRKAEAALAFDMPSSEANDLAQKDKSALRHGSLSMLLDGGAVPITVNGKLIGAIGASGAAGKVIGGQDEACARAGLKVILGG